MYLKYKIRRLSDTHSGTNFEHIFRVNKKESNNLCTLLGLRLYSAPGFNHLVEPLRVISEPRRRPNRPAFGHRQDLDTHPRLVPREVLLHAGIDVGQNLNDLSRYVIQSTGYSGRCERGQGSGVGELHAWADLQLCSYPRYIARDVSRHKTE